MLVPSHQVSENLRFDKEDDDAARVAGVEGVVTRGDAVFVKIVEIKDDPRDAAGPPRVTASMKLCDQGSGADLDPDGARYRPAATAAPKATPARATAASARRRPRARLGGHRLGPPRGGRGQMRLLGDGEPPDGGARYDLLEDDPEATARCAARASTGAGRTGARRRRRRRGPAARRRRHLRGASPRARPGGSRQVNSVEEALAILAKHKREKKARKAEKKARKKARKKEKKSSKRSRKEARAKRRERSSSGSSGSSSESSDDAKPSRDGKRERRRDA